MVDVNTLLRIEPWPMVVGTAMRGGLPARTLVDDTMLCDAGKLGVEEVEAVWVGVGAVTTDVMVDTADAGTVVSGVDRTVVGAVTVAEISTVDFESATAAFASTAPPDEEV